MRRILGMLAIAGLTAAAAPSMAATVVGGYNFADNAFADTLISSSGSFTTSGGSLSSVLTDTNAGTYAFSFSPNAFVQMGFTDNLLVNGAGVDLVLFELGVPDSFRLSITIGGTTIVYNTVDTGDNAGGFNLNAVGIDLSDFGIGAGASLSSVVIGMDIAAQGGTVPSLSLVGALNSADVNGVPEPASLALVGLALAGLAAARRRKR